MTEIMVDLVKYDTEKTKKRKRSKILVADKSENAVIEKLEKIHKGDKIIAIHEIVWGEEFVKPKLKFDINRDKPKEVLTGIVKFYDDVKGYGFIQSDTDIDDLFFHASALDGETLYEQDPVEFETKEGAKGLSATRIRLISED
jgi:CspA family cold shock protein